MMRWVPPLCLFLALATLVAGFALWNVEPPQASPELHQARVSGDEDYERALEITAPPPPRCTAAAGGTVRRKRLVVVAALLCMPESAGR